MEQMQTQENLEEMKVKEKNDTFMKVVRYTKKYHPFIIISLAFAIGAVFIQLIAPSLVRDMTNYILEGIGIGFVTGEYSTHANVVRTGVTLIILYSVMFVIFYIQQITMARVSVKVSLNLRTDMGRKINRLPLSYLDSTQVGENLSRITNDVDSLTRSLNWSASAIITATVMIIGSLIFMFVNQWLMALTALGSTIFGFFLMGVIMGKAQKYFVAQQAELGDINAHTEEYFTGHTVLKTNNARTRVSGAFDTKNHKLYNSSWKAQFYGGLMIPLMFFLGNLAFVTVSIVGGVLAFNGTITFGVIIAFMLYVDLFTRPLGDIAQAMMEMQTMNAAAKRIFELLEQPEMSDDESLESIDHSEIKGDVQFKNVKFGYNEDTPIIHNFSVDIKAGSKVAIVGPTGAGKTTLVNLLMRFYDIGGGDITIDKQSIYKLRRNDVASSFSMVLQDSWIFNGTIKENLLYNMNIPKELEETILDQTCKAVGIDYFINTLPNGYETVLDDNSDVSEGQKQLLTIARAMIKDAPLLILDEATASVDTRTELIVKEAMDKLTSDRTSFIIAHRLSTIKNADMILVMNKGDIVESGTHAELLEKEGFYAELYNSQFTN
ncbi:MAG: ABC transporter ATP-binding protein/permease [Erysipelotrichales bacterium]|nr:ABC transporter ATP-binding protein/permease [Erysipelotrichales bacterium]